MNRGSETTLGTPDVQPTSLAGPGDVDQIEGRPPLPFFVIYVAGQPKRKKVFPGDWNPARTGQGKVGIQRKRRI
jgi:hypothetical protein